MSQVNFGYLREKNKGDFMKKERLFYLDFVRAIAVISIIITHFNARYLYLSPPMPEKAVLTTTVSNIYIGSWGVSLFFIISGAALMYVYQERIEIKNFYRKRFLSIYPMFWIAYIIAFFYLFYTNKMIPGSGAPKINFIYTILGMDGMVAAYIPTYYILGEWFLGAIILMYILFPLLRIGVKKQPIMTFGISLLIYGLIIICIKDINVSIIILTRLPEILFGMLYAQSGKKINWKMAVSAMIILVGNSIIKPSFPEAIQTTYVGIASFVLLVYLSYWFKFKICHYLCNIISKYSYAIFLVHHVIISEMMMTFDLTNISRGYSYVLFAVICLVIAVIAWGLYHFHAYIMSQISILSNK